MLLGVDPGRSKTGWAFCGESGDLLLSGITPTGEMPDFIAAVCARGQTGFEKWSLEGEAARLAWDLPLRVLLGKGTGSRAVRGLFEESGIRPEGVDESYTTLRARELFWVLHPPRGWRRWIPLSLQVPPRDVDDLAAWAMVLAFSGTGALQ